MIRVKYFARMAVTATAAVGLTAGSAHAEFFLLSDDFEHGTTDNWYRVGNSYDLLDMSVVDDQAGIGSGNALRLAFDEGSGTAASHAEFNPVTLSSVGDYVQMSFDVRAEAPLPAGGRVLMFGLRDSAGTPVTEDGTGPANDGYGYISDFGVGETGATWGGRNAQLFQDQEFNNVFQTNWSRDFIQGTYADEARLYDEDPANVGLRIERSDVEDLTISLIVDGDTLVEAALSDYSGSQDDPFTPNTYTFGQVNIGTRTIDDEFSVLVDNVSVTSNIPEPGSLALLGAGGLMLLHRRRRSGA